MRSSASGLFLGLDQVEFRPRADGTGPPRERVGLGRFVRRGPGRPVVQAATFIAFPDQRHGSPSRTVGAANGREEEPTMALRDRSKMLPAPIDGLPVQVCGLLVAGPVRRFGTIARDATSRPGPGFED